MNANEFTFGIEIECLVPYASMSAQGWTVGSYHHGAAIPQHDGWKAKTDGSLRAEAGFAALEVVSPVLKGEAGVEAVLKIVAQLNQMGAKVNASTGFHVHVGCKADLAVIRRLIGLVANLEKGIYASTGTKAREQSPWCRSVKAKLKPVYDAATQQNLRRVAGSHQDRYHLLNLTNIVAGTRDAVEFRAFSGTLNAAKILGYVFMCVGLVEKATEEGRLAAWEAKPTKETSPVKRGGEGETCLNRLFKTLGWVAGYHTAKVYGVMQGVDMKTVRKELFRLAAKYDAA